ncbi:L-threonylcarbamoyladenylate synthase [Aeromonas schubertii]
MSPLTTLMLPGVCPDALEQAAALLRSGAQVAVPTETVYGLAADAAQPEAVAGIFRAKGRPSDHPLIVHLAHADQMARWAREIPATAWQLAQACWPGPLTLLLKRAEQVSPVVTGGLDTIGLRVPAHPLMLALLERLDTGLAAPSANPYQALSPTSAEQVEAGLGGRIAAILDGGPCPVGLESTIVDLTGPVPTIVRAGPLGRETLESILGQPVATPREHTVVVPGNVAAHYRPGTPLWMAPTDALEQHLARLASRTLARGALITWSNALAAPAELGQLRRLPADPAGYGQALYATLFELDRLGLETLWLEQPPQSEPWWPVQDRLRRATMQLE